MKNSTNNVSLNKTKNLEAMSGYTLFISKEEFIELTKGEKITVDYLEISIEFLIKIITDNSFFEYALKYFNGEIDNFVVTYIFRGKIGRSISYKKSVIIRAIDKLIFSKNISLSPEMERNFERLKKCVLFEELLKKYESKLHNICIDDKNYSISIKQIISFVQLPDDEFEKICFNNNVKDLYGIPKEYFIYAVVDFFKTERIMDNFLIPEDIIKRYKSISSFKIIDFEALNEYLVITDTKYCLIKMDADLKKSILEGIPENASDIEKAIYIYIKMCKLLTYDVEFYVVSQRGAAAEKHKQLEHISSITLMNNEVVCYEFNLMYAKLLAEFDIKFSIKYRKENRGLESSEDLYGKAHSKIYFRSGKFLVGVDSVESVLKSDLTNAKLNQTLTGIKCINKNHQTQQEFKDALERIYKLIIHQDENMANNLVLNELLEGYIYLTQNICSINLMERLSILVDRVNSTNLVGLDLLSYVLQLRNILFTEKQRKENIKVTIVRNNHSLVPGKEVFATVIFVLNMNNIEENENQNIYYYYDPKQKLMEISKDELQKRFDDGVYSYINDNHPLIPGIIANKGVNK